MTVTDDAAIPPEVAPPDIASPNRPDSPTFDPELASDEAPYGWTRDKHGPQKNIWRPRIKRGAPSARVIRGQGLGPDGSPPAVDDLKAAHHARRGKPDHDRPPGKPSGKRQRQRRHPADDTDLPPFKAGPIATGMNRMYARAGKIIAVGDPDIGNAILMTTRKASPDDVTVGEAWEELARTNPRIRRVLLKAVAGGAWGQLVAAHGPIIVAILTKDAVRRRLPLNRVISAVFESTEEGRPSEATQATGLTPEDAAAMMAMGQQLFAQMFTQAPPADGRQQNNQPRGPVVVIDQAPPADGEPG